MDSVQIGPPAQRPCDSCPYRRDVPSGVWDRTEYAKLRRYDRPTGEQPTGVWQCHVTDSADRPRRICAGWAGCHDGDHLLAVRVAVAAGTISPDTAQQVVDYHTPVPLFSSGAEAADHGERDLAEPSLAAVRVMQKIQRLETQRLWAPSRPFSPDAGVVPGSWPCN